MESPFKIIEPFRTHLHRRFAFKVRYLARSNVVSWESRNRGAGIAPWDGKNRQKRERAKNNKHHVPKLKKVPLSVFE